MNNIYEIDLTRTLPPALKNDKKMLALSQGIAEELRITAENIKLNVIYARIGELPERWLDILAYDLHVDWYDYDYPLEVKRAIIKDSVKVHAKLGTKYAVETALGGLHPNSEIEEWFDYNGEPFGFRIILDTTKSRVTAEYEKIVKTVNIYKRLTAHLDSLYYQCSINVTVVAKVDYFRFRTAMAGKIKTGTEPHRNKRGGIANGSIKVSSDFKGYAYESILAGTKPDRNIVFQSKDSEVVTESDTIGYRFNSVPSGTTDTGTTPYTNMVGSAIEKGITQTAAVETYRYNITHCGTKICRNK